MALSATSTGFDADIWQEFTAARNEPDWILELRRQAFELYQEKLAEPLDPEEYKRVDLRTFRPEKYALQPAGAAASTGELDTLMQDRGEFAGRVTHVDGHCTSSELSRELADKGVLFGDLATLLNEHRERLEPYFHTQAVDPSRDRFSAWHAAFWTGGTVLFVPRNVELDAPLYSLIGLQADGAADFSHTLIILEEGASATPAGGDGVVLAGHRRPARRSGRADRRTGSPTAVRAAAELEREGSAFRPSVGPRRAGQHAAVDRRRTGSQAGAHPPGRASGWSRGPCRGEWRDVCHRPPAALLLHAADAPPAGYPLGSALQGSLPRQVAGDLARHDQGGSGRSADRRIPAERRADAQPRRPGPMPSPVWRSRRTTSAARMERRPAASTRSRSSTRWGGGCPATRRCT